MGGTDTIIVVTGPESIAALRDFLERTFGRLDVLINNAGIITDEEASGLEVKLSTVRTTLETNTLAPLHLGQVLAPVLKRSRAGRIVNMSSGMGALSDMEGGYAAYRISKAALNAERDVAQGAGTAVWLALDAPQDLIPARRKVIPW
jgi:NAD(P)-dependent dehydrogenase (short-subunit alcohol dehydrogenase family)